VEAKQSAMVGVLVPTMLAPVTVSMLMVNRQTSAWTHWILITLMLGWIVLGAALLGKAMRPQLLSVDDHGVRYGRRELTWPSIRKLVVQQKGRQIHLHAQSKWAGTQMYDIREDQTFAEAAEELARRAERAGVPVERR
jgi:hypothetical protein